MSAKKRHTKDEPLMENEVQDVEENRPPMPPDGDEAGPEMETLATEENPLAVQLNQAEARAAEYLDSLQRERAAFQNYKRRVEREREEQAYAASGRVLVRLLPVLDDFYRAMDAVPTGDHVPWFSGVELILRKLERFLQDQDVKEIAALGQPFDPNFHEAIGVDSATDAPSGTVTAVLQRGYLHGERVLRPAMVRVAE
jgi:molecular chaperone GrpE